MAGKHIAREFLRNTEFGS